MSLSLEWKWTLMELTHGSHELARELAVVDGPFFMHNAMAFHMPQAFRDNVGHEIVRCHRAQFGK